MTISHQKDYKRYRVYISLGHKDSIQRVYGYGEQGKYSNEKEALAAATLEHDLLRIKHRPVDRTHPFALDNKHSMGKRSESPLNIRNMIIAIASMRDNCEPDWSINPNHKEFHTYAPYIQVQRFKYVGEKRLVVASERIPINSSRSYRQSCIEAVDAHIRIFPEFKDYRSAMIAEMPRWSVVWAFIQRKAKERYGDRLILHT